MAEHNDTGNKAEAMAAKLHGQLIDREHPLWEFHVFDSIKPPAGMKVEGKLVGFYSKIHHAALDGKGGTVLANAMLDVSSTPREVAPPDPARLRLEHHREGGIPRRIDRSDGVHLHGNGE